ncbi:MAG: ankyrin repeat domain-containing protein [Bacteroidetes bacterium]|nr:MAG: ankyrin repeat domain-containing protein [Bacteroidota bacterium]
MKTQKMNLMKAATSMMMVAALLILNACGSNQEKSTSNEEEAQTSEVSVKAPNMDIHTATLLGDLDAIKQHIAAGSDLDEKEPTLGSTPLISAAVFGKTEIAKALIEGGADVNLKNNEGSTALHSAAFLCRMEIVEMLLANGADKALLNNYGSTALQSVTPPFASVKPIYEQFNEDLGPLGFKLDYEYAEATRPKIAEILR